MTTKNWDWKEIQRTNLNSKNQCGITVEVVICINKNCNGKGYTLEEECVDYHKRDYEYIKRPCGYCAGTGRLYKRTVVEYQPIENYELPPVGPAD
jgi:hypothetical protein